MVVCSEEAAPVVDTSRESLRLKLPMQILDLLPHMVSSANSVLHINAFNDQGTLRSSSIT